VYQARSFGLLTLPGFGKGLRHRLEKRAQQLEALFQAVASILRQAQYIARPSTRFLYDFTQGTIAEGSHVPAA
jgi:hypothetical protein